MAQLRIALFLIFLVFIMGCKANNVKIIDKICAQQGKVQVSKCGIYFSSYPQGFVQDASTAVYDAGGNYIYSCGGFKAFTNNEEREKEQKLCDGYLNNCKIVKSC